ncbi:MAG: hypothetical protein P4L63_01770 [Candidatus Pacebacteria bacterium]|nr:hypothetical protein [Candidatus Paceibacterota bacterium]
MKNNQKGFASLVLVGVLVVLVAVGGYFLWSKKVQAPVSVAQPVTQTPAVAQTNTTTSPSVIDTSSWKTWNGVFKYPSDWEEIKGAPILVDFMAAPGGSTTSSAFVEYGSVHEQCGKNYGANEVKSSFMISGKTLTRLDTTGNIEIYYCDLAPEQASLNDGDLGSPATEWDMQLGYSSSATKAIDEAIISTLNLK